MNCNQRCISRFTYLLLAGYLVGSVLHGQTIFTNGTVNSADYSRSFAPGALISIFGTNLATSTAQPSAFPLPTTLGGATVTVVNTGQQLPLWYASPGQLNGELPFNLSTGQVQLRVTTSAGTSNVDTITVAAQAPKFFTLDFTGAGTAVTTNPAFQILTAANPVKPADTIILWMNSLGPTTGSPVAGQPAPGNGGTAALTLLTQPTVTINGINAPVSFAGLSPGSSGLYQVNVQAPFVVLSGGLSIQLTAGGVTTQANVTVPYRQLGFYSALLGGKAVTGQSLNGVTGASSALTFRQSDALTWGNVGFNAWTNNTGLGAPYLNVSGTAITLKNGTSVVYDNNGIETGTAGTFYNNAGGGADNTKAGLSDLYSMSNYFPLVFSGYIKLAQATTITELIGYFDPNSSQTIPFDPQNPYVKYRLNIWSNTGTNLPKETNGFAGDVLTSDTTAGTFSISDTGIKMISSVATNFPKPIMRLSYKLNAAVTLPAGEYWISHDASVRSAAAASSTSQVIRPQELETMIKSQKVPDRLTRFNLFGRDMEFRDSFDLPQPVVVRPAAPIEQH